MNKQDSYEELINGSPVFGMKPDQEEYFYKTECNRLIKYVYLYLTSVQRGPEVDGLAVTETVIECLKYYKPESGPFLNYFLVSYKKEKTKAESREKLAQRSGGIHLSRAERTASGKICNYLKNHPGVNEDDLINLLDQYTDALGMTREELKQAVRIYRDSQAEFGDAPAGNEDSGGTRFDSIADTGANFVELLISSDRARQIIDILEEEYLASRDSAKELLAMKLTSSITADGQEELIGYIRDKAFFHEKAWLYGQQSGAVLKNKQISQIIGKSEANITQTWKRFEDRLRKRLQSDYGE